MEMIRSAETACSAPQLGQTTTSSETGAFRSISATTLNFVPHVQRNFFTVLLMRKSHRRKCPLIIVAGRRYVAVFQLLTLAIAQRIH
jgi:hypothetical protein